MSYKGQCRLFNISERADAEAFSANVAKPDSLQILGILKQNIVMADETFKAVRLKRSGRARLKA